MGLELIKLGLLIGIFIMCVFILETKHWGG